MSVARVTEISSQSSRSIEDAIRQGVRRANQTLRNVTGAWIKEQQVQISDGRITGYRVNMLVTFILEGGDPVAATRAAAPAAKKAPAKKAAKKKSARRRR
jgi:flavin-binding protein dodecin